MYLNIELKRNNIVAKLIVTAFAILHSSMLWGTTLTELSERTDISRLEFAMFTINQKLYEEFRYNSLLTQDLILNQYFNESLDTDQKFEYTFSTYMSGETLYITAVLNESIRCTHANPVLSNNDMKDRVSHYMDELAKDIMFFLGHFGEYEKESLFGNNMVHHRVAALFGYSDYSTTNLEHLALGEAISENFKVLIATNYCEKDNNISTELKYVYPLNADYNLSNVEGEKTFPARYQLEGY